MERSDLRPMDGGLTQRSVIRRGGIRENISFVYTEPFFNHFKFRHQVDNHNNARVTKDWKMRVFTFILAVVEVNARLAHSFFTQSDALSQLDFRRLLVKEVMNFSFVVGKGDRKRSRRSMERVASACGV